MDQKGRLLRAEGGESAQKRPTSLGISLGLKERGAVAGAKGEGHWCGHFLGKGVEHCAEAEPPRFTFN